MSTTLGPRLSVLHLTAGSDAGGLSRYILDICAGLRAQGHRVAVAGDVGVWQPRFEDAGIEYLRIPLKGGPLSVLRSLRTIRQYVSSHGNFDVYHAHYRRAAMLGRRLQTTSPAPLLYTVHLSHIDVSWHRRLLTDFGDFTHFASADALLWAQAKRLCRPEGSRCGVIPHGVDLGRYRAPSDAERIAARAALCVGADSRFALYVGRLDDPKNVDWLLDVAAEWKRTRAAPLLLAIAGDGPQRAAIAARIVRDRLADHVKLLGEVDPLPVYHAADLLLLPSAREGFSYVCAEAMACGVPVLRTRTSGTTEMIQENVTGRSVAIDRSAFVRAAVAMIGEDTATLRAMGESAARLARSQFSLERQIRQTLDLYAELRSQHAGRSQHSSQGSN